MTSLPTFFVGMIAGAAAVWLVDRWYVRYLDRVRNGHRDYLRLGGTITTYSKER